MGRLVMVEGIPGSGKTTISGKITEYLSKKKKTNFYKEGDAHPADLAWCACIPKGQYQNVIGEFPQYAQEMKKHGYEEGDFIIVPYTRFTIEDHEFFQRMEGFEVYDNRVGYDTFVDLHNRKWIRFCEQAKSVDEFSVFECAFLQNHINELLLFHCRTQKEIEDYLIRLVVSVTDLKPVLIYLNQPDVAETIRRVGEIRVDDKGDKIWEKRVIAYIEECPYGKQHHLAGFDGMVKCFTERKRIEMEILKKLPIETYIINNPAYQWEQVWDDIEKIIGKL